MALSYTTYQADGNTKQFAIPFGYLRRNHVFVFVDGTMTGFKWISPTNIEIDPAPANAAEVKVQRMTDKVNRITDFADGQTLLAGDLDAATLQNFYIVQEMIDGITDGVLNGDVAITNPPLPGNPITTQQIQDLLNEAARNSPVIDQLLNDTLVNSNAIVDETQNRLAALADEAAARLAGLADEAQARAGAIAAEAAARQQALTDEQNARIAQINGLQQQIDTDVANLTALSNALTQEVTDRQNAVQTNANNLAQEILDRQAGDNALDSRVDAVVASVDSNAALIATEQQARIDGDDVLASQLNVVSAAANRVRTFRQPTAPATGMEEGDLWFDTDGGNKAHRFDGTNWVETDDARIADALAQIATETTARVDGDNALASQITSLTAQVDGNSADIITVNEAVTNEASARATAISGLQTQVDDANALIASNSTAISNESSARASEVSTITARLDGVDQSLLPTDVAHIGAQGDVTFKPNMSWNDISSPGEIGIPAGFIHIPGVGRVDYSSGTLNTPYESGLLPPYGRFYIFAMPGDREARFPAASGFGNPGIPFFNAERDPATGQWYAVPNVYGERIAFTPADDDVLVAMVEGDGSGFTRITSLMGDLGPTEAAIISEQTARVNADSAMASDISGLTTRMGTAEADIVSNQTAISTESSARASAVSGLQAQIDDNEAAIISESNARASADSVQASQITGLTTRMDGAEANIISNANAISNESSSRATQFNSVNARLDSTDEGLLRGDDFSITFDRPELWSRSVSYTDMDAYSPVTAYSGTHGLGTSGGLPAYVSHSKRYIGPRYGIAVQPGDRIKTRWKVAVNTNGTNGLGSLFSIYWYGHSSPTTFVTGTWMGDTRVTTADGVTFIEGEATVPAGVFFIRPYLYVNAVDGEDAETVVWSFEVKNVSREFDIEASVISEQNARVAADSAIASDVTGLTTRMGDAEADIITNQTAISTESSARTSAVNVLTARVGRTEEADVNRSSDGFTTNSYSPSQTTQLINWNWINSDNLGGFFRSTGTGFVQLFRQKMEGAEPGKKYRLYGRVRVDTDATNGGGTVCAVRAVYYDKDGVARAYPPNAAVAFNTHLTAADGWIDLDHVFEVEANPPWPFLGLEFYGNWKGDRSTNGNAIWDVSDLRFEDVTHGEAVKDDLEAQVVSEQTARVNADGALASDITGLTTRMGDAEADIITNQTAISNETSARVSDVSVLTASIERGGTGSALNYNADMMEGPDGWLHWRNSSGSTYSGEVWDTSTANSYEFRELLSPEGRGLTFDAQVEGDVSCWFYNTRSIPVDTSKRYRVKLRVYVHRSGGTIYPMILTQDGAFTFIGGGAGTHRYGGAQAPTGAAGSVQELEFIITGEGDNSDQFRPGTKYVRVGGILNYNGSGANSHVTVLECSFTEVEEAQAALDNATAQVVSEAAARASADSAQASDISGLLTRMGDAEADIVSNSTAISDETSARTSAFNSLRSSFGSVPTKIYSPANGVSTLATDIIGSPEAAVTPSYWATASSPSRFVANGTGTSHIRFLPKDVIPVVPGTELRVKLRIRLLNAPAYPNPTGPEIAYYAQTLNSDFSGNTTWPNASGLWLYNVHSFANDEWINLELTGALTQTMVDNGVAYVRVGALTRYVSAVPSGASMEVEWMQVEQSSIHDADAEAALAAESSTRASADSAQASDIAGLTTRMGDAEADITTNATAISTESSARATEVKKLSARFGASGATFPASLGAGEFTSSTSGAPESSPDLPSTDWSYGQESFGSYFFRPGNAGLKYLLTKALVPVQGGKRYRMSIVARYRGSVAGNSDPGHLSVFFRTQTSTHGYLRAEGFKTVKFTQGNFARERFETEFVAPNDTAWARPGLYTRGDCTLTANIDILSITVEEESASITEVRDVFANASGEFEALYTLRTNVNGHVAGFGLSNDGTTSNFSILADNFQIVDPSNNNVVSSPFGVIGGVTYITNARIGGAQIDDLTVDKLTAGNLGANITIDGELSMGNGKITFDNGVYMKVQGVAFGANNDLIEWYGPKMAITACTKANAIMYLGTDGSAYFGGNLSAGTLTNSGQSTNTQVPSEIEVGPFGTNGSPISVSYSFLFNRGGGRVGNQTASGTTSATLKLYRKIGTGPEALIATKSVTGSVSAFYDPGQNQTNFVEGMSGQWTYTDNAGGTGDRTYRWKIETRSLATIPGTPTGADQFTQNLSVVCTEE